MSKELANPLTHDDNAIAPRWHTTLLVFVIVGVNVTGAILSRGVRAATPVDVSLAGAWIPLLVVQWGLLLYCVRVGQSRSVLPDLLGAGWKWSDVAIAALLVAFVLGAEHVLAPARAEGAAALLPRTVAEKAAWLVVAASVGFCEEVVYRGYLQRQLGVVLQAVLFGIAHAQQGAATSLRFAAYGALFGVVARARSSLAAVILCHVALDALAGLAFRG